MGAFPAMEMVWTVAYLLDAVEEGISNVPLVAVSQVQPPGKPGLVQIHE